MSAPTSAARGSGTGRPGRLLLRADAGAGRGVGHVARSAVLARAWIAAGGQATLAVTAAGADRAAVVADGVPLVPVAAEPGSDDVAATRALMADHDWLVVDGYPFPDDLGPAVTGDPARVVRIDDHGHAGAHPAAVVVDQNLGADAGPYRHRPPGSSLLLGPRYALVDPPVVAGPAGARVVVLLGGDPAPAVVESLAMAVAPLVGTVPVVAAGGGDLGPLVDVGGSVEGFVADPFALVGPDTVVVAAAGTVTWTLLAGGVPSVLVATVANQVPVVAAAVAAGAALGGDLDDLGPVGVESAVTALLDDGDAGRALGAAGRRLVDGRGAARVVAAIRSHDVALRPVAAGDAELLWGWANDPDVRAMAFSPAPIPWEDHLAWFTRGLTDPGRTHLVAVDDDGPWAQVRFDLLADEPDVALVDVSIAGPARGSGRAAALLRAATRRLLADRPGLRGVRAEVRAGNDRSAAAFDRAGFREEAPRDGGAVRRFWGEAGDGW